MKLGPQTEVPEVKSYLDKSAAGADFVAPALLGSAISPPMYSP